MNGRFVLVLSSVSIGVLFLSLVVLFPDQCCSLGSKLMELRIKQGNDRLSTPHRKLVRGKLQNENFHSGFLLFFPNVLLLG
ncbi:hypothetical protein V6N11_015289 [Hibiscus sabdariffa]|uniref:Secreted peptide n=1 Tax=Hibiscus sabdariffa TaxID=183260 RepID=A0ABR2TRM0_9ROSI